MRRRIILSILAAGTIHFLLSMVAMVNGFIIFRGPSTPEEIFWQDAMNVLLFPANVVFQGVATTWLQTLALILNSLVWGSAVVACYFGLRKLMSTKRSR